MPTTEDDLSYIDAPVYCTKLSEIPLSLTKGSKVRVQDRVARIIGSRFESRFGANLIKKGVFGKMLSSLTFDLETDLALFRDHIGVLDLLYDYWSDEAEPVLGKIRTPFTIEQLEDHDAGEEWVLAEGGEVIKSYIAELHDTLEDRKKLEEEEDEKFRTLDLHERDRTGA